MKIESPSTWHASVKLPRFPRLNEDIETNVCIIGGGLTGLLTAYLLGKSGVRVVVLEKGRIGSGATGRTTAFLTQAIDTDFQDLIKMVGEDKAKKVLGSHRFGIELIERIAREEAIECEFVRCSNYLYATTASEYEYLQKEEEALRALGADVGLEKPDLHFPQQGALEFRQQAKYHPLKFLAGLARATEKVGVRIYEESEAHAIEKDPRRVVGKHFTVRANFVISATYSPFNEPRQLYLKKGMYVTYVEELRMQKGILREGMYEDLANPYHYFRVDDKGSYDRVIVGGEDHRADIKMRPSKNLKALDDFLRLTFRGISFETVRKWRGPILEPIDGLAFVGQSGPSDILYAFGFSGSGMTYAPIAARMLHDMCLGKESGWKEVYDADRMPGPLSLILKGRDYAEELLQGAVKNSLTYRQRDPRRSNDHAPNRSESLKKK